MFNIFKKKEKEDSNSPAHEDWIKAKELVEKTEFSDALSTLINGFKKDIYYQPLYELSSTCLAKMGGKDESELFKKAINNLNSNTFKQLGNHFYNVEHYPLTKIFLEESFKKIKDIEVANNLAIAYARRFDTKKAQQTLASVKDKFDFWTYWFYVKMKILNNDRVDLEESINGLARSFDINSQDENLRIPKQKVNELIESYDRLKLIGNPDQKIKDWQFIQYGTLMLNFFFSDDQYVAGGRHVASWGNNEPIKSILSLLSSLIKEKEIERIIYGEDRDSKIIGMVLSILSDIPSEVFNSTTIYNLSLIHI